MRKLLIILDKKLQINKENNLNNDASNTYTQCTTNENEVKKVVLHPRKKLNKLMNLMKNLFPKKNQKKNIRKKIPRMIWMN